MKFLLLDDIPDDRELIKYRLRKVLGDLEFIEAGDRPEFEAALAQGGFDAVLTDYALIWTNGLTVLRKLKAAYPDVPVVMVTGTGNEAVAAEGMRSGLSDYVLKQHLERLPFAVQDILERERLRQKRDEAIEQLRQSEERHRLISELISDFAFALRIHPDGSLTREWATSAFVLLAGYTFDEYDEMGNPFAIFHPDDRARAQAQYQSAARGETVVDEFRILHKDGSVRWVRIYLHPLKDDQGRVIRVYGAAQDITARKEAEAAERDQRLLAEALRDTAAALTGTLNSDDLLERILANVGRVVPHETANVMLIEQTEAGESIARVVGMRGYDQFGPAKDWMPTSRWPVQQFFTLREMARTQQPLVIADTRASAEWMSVGPVEWVRAWIGVPLCLRGEVLGFITLTSATPGFFQAEAAERLQAFAAQAAVALHNVRLYNSVRQQAAELESLYRASGPLVGASTDPAQLARQIVETLAAELSFDQCGIGLLDESGQKMVLVADTGDIGAARTERALALDGPSLSAAAARSGEIIYAPDVTADPRYVMGKVGTQSELVIPLKVAGHVLGVLDLQSTRRDAFSERDRRLLSAYAERAALALENTLLLTRLTEARQAAEAANRAKTEFLANTSHELRTPLTGILGSLDIVLEGLCDSPEEERRFIEVAYTASGHLLGLINNLLDVAKIEAGRIELDWQAVDVSLVLAEVRTLTQAQIVGKAVRLEMRPPSPDASTVWGDHGRVRQILINLLDNAVKFTAQGQITLSAEASASDGSRQMTITVQDTGIGIPVDQQARLFEAFTQADSSTTRKYGGTGLGLSISRRLAELMGGSLTLYSAGENQGATFTLLLPAAPPQPEA